MYSNLQARGSPEAKTKEGTPLTENGSHQQRSSPPKSPPKRPSPQVQSPDISATPPAGTGNFKIEGQQAWVKDGRPKQEIAPVSHQPLNVDLYLVNQPDWGTPGSPSGHYQPSEVLVSKPTMKNIKETCK